VPARSADTAGQAGLVARFASAPGRDFPLRLQERATQADARTQTYRFRFRMAQPDGITILPGMTANVVRDDSLLAADVVIMVPAAAVWADDLGKPHVWVVDATMRVERRAVTPGDLADSDSLRIASGLAAGDKVAVSAVSRLRDGMEVRAHGE